MNIAKRVKEYADWADRAGKPDLPIRVPVTRHGLKCSATRSGVDIGPRAKGWPLFFNDHRIITTDEGAPSC